LDSPDIDFLTGITSYSNRGLGGPGSFMLPVRAFRRQASSTTARWTCARIGAADPWTQVTNAAESVAVYRREFAHQLVHGCAWWNFDMQGGW